MTDDEWTVSITFSPKTYDIDAMGVVSNITYVRWLEDLRTRFLEKNLPWNELQDHGLAPVLAETNIHYKQPLRMGDKTQGKLKLVELGRTTWYLKFLFETDGETIIEAEQSGLFVDTETHRPRKLPQPLKERIETG